MSKAKKRWIILLSIFIGVILAASLTFYFVFDVKNWQKLINSYLVGRATLRRVFLLIDSRHGIKKIDEEIMEMLDKAAVTYQIVLTKIDKISTKELEKVLTATDRIVREHTAAHVTILKTSSEKNLYLDELKAETADLL